MAGEKQPFLVFLGLWKIQFPLGHIYCPTFSHLSLYFLRIPSRIRNRTLLLVWIITPVKIKWGIAHCSQHPLMLELASSVVQYICLPLVPVSHCLPEVTTFLYFPARISLPVYLPLLISYSLQTPSRKVFTCSWFSHSPIFQLWDCFFFG